MPDYKDIVSNKVVNSIIDLSLEEDFGPAGDVTAPIAPDNRQSTAVIVAREDGIVCGLPIAKEVFRRVDASLRFRQSCDDGDSVKAGDALATLKGSAHSILAGERTALNFMQRLSGISTLTRQYVDAVSGTEAKVLDTRKTLPGWRLLSKYAVHCGGGTNHRMGLYDQILIKDNHLALLGGEVGVKEAVEAAFDVAKEGILIEIEVTTMEGALAAAMAGAHIVLLDNMSVEDMRQTVIAVEQACKVAGKDKPQLEASGGITLETIAEVAKTGVERISSGALTHSAKAMDIALDMDLKPKGHRFPPRK